MNIEKILRRRVFVALTLASGLANHAAGQCSDILQQGIFNTLSYENVTEYQSDLVFVLSHSKKEMEQLKSKKDERLTLKIKKLFDLGFSSDSEDEQVRQLAEQLKIDQRSSIQFSNLTNVSLKVVSKDIVSAWENCERSKGALSTEIIGKPKNGDQFIVVVSYRAVAATDPNKLKITNVSITGADVVGNTVLAQGATLGGFSSLSQVLRRSGREAVAIVVDFEGAKSLVASLDQMPPETPPELPPSTKEETILPTTRSFTPPKIGKGDADFNTGADDPMKVRADAKLNIFEERSIILQLSMSAKEPRKDWTEVKGETQPDDEMYRLYTAPTGWRIKRIISPDITQDYVAFDDAATGPKTILTEKAEETREQAILHVSKQKGIFRKLFGALSLWQTSLKASNNSVVKEWHIQTDSKGDEAGSWTSVTVKLKTIKLELEKLP